MINASSNVLFSEIRSYILQTLYSIFEYEVIKI